MFTGQKRKEKVNSVALRNGRMANAAVKLLSGRVDDKVCPQ